MRRSITGCLLFTIVAFQPTSGRQQDAAAHHARGVEFMMRRCLDEASGEFDKALALDPPRDPDERQRLLIERFAPRLHVARAEPFPLKDFAAVMHPSERFIAYHLFWEDDIDFPEDNDPSDHEVVWVKYAVSGDATEAIWTYFHRRMLRGGDAALADARAHGGRPRINVQWGKHGSIPLGWESMQIVADAGDIEGRFYPVGTPITLKVYNEGTFRKLSTLGTRLSGHPLAVRAGWPRRFSGTWEEFSAFTKAVDPLPLLRSRRMILVSRWNTAVINRHFLRYNFRPKTEWPE